MIKQLLNGILIVCVLQSCVGQDKPKYKKAAIEMNTEAGKYRMDFKADSALVLYDKAIELDETYYFPHVNKATIYLENKQFNKAIFELEIALEKKPDLAESWTALGALYDYKGQSEKANTSYKKSIDIFSKRIENSANSKLKFANQLNRALSYILMGQGELGKIELRLLKKEDPNNLMVDTLLASTKKDIINLLIGI